MNRYEVIESDGVSLTLLCATLHSGDVPSGVVETTRQAFSEIAPHLHQPHQVLYIRDMPAATIDGIYPSGHCYNAHEAMIAVNDWVQDELQLAAAIFHELHHLARWQNAGYGQTLGEVILSEGIASYYEELRSGWTPPWVARVDKRTIAQALESWDDTHYSHQQWFFEGKHGKWVGYGIGYMLARELFKDGFDFARSVSIEIDEATSVARQLIS